MNGVNASPSGGVSRGKRNGKKAPGNARRREAHVIRE